MMNAQRKDTENCVVGARGQTLSLPRRQAHPRGLSNEELLEAVARLIAERPDVPPGSVLSCFSRAVRASLRAGCAPSRAVAEAERLTREVLAQRAVVEAPPRPRAPGGGRAR